MREKLFRWFGHMQHRPISLSIRKSNTIMINVTMKTRERPKRTCMEAIKNDMLILHVTDEWPLIELNGRNDSCS